MTCVVGIEHDGGVLLGADSALSDAPGGLCLLSAAPKLGNWGAVAWGVAGDVRAWNVVRCYEPSPYIEGDPLVWVVRQVAEPLRDLVEDAELELLVGAGGRLFILDGSGGVFTSFHGYAAVGCGAGPALGALAVSGAGEPRARLEAALAAAERHADGVRGPWRWARS